MISFCVSSEYGQDTTDVSFAGDEEEALAHVLGATLLRLGWEVQVSRDDGEFYTLGEDEEPLDG